MPKDQQQPQQKTIAPGTVVQRSILFERTAIDETSRTVQLAFASETPYERFFGIEILDCAPTSMRMGRLTSGGPLLADHNSRDQIGVVESVSIGADRVARAVVRFGKSARASEFFQDVVDGIRRNVSVGYQIHAAQLVETRDGVDTYRVTDWEPMEVSIVSVPADTTVGVGRSVDAPQAPVIVSANPHQPVLNRKESNVTTPDTTTAPAAPAPAPAAPAITSADMQRQVAQERKQISEMLALGELHERFGGRKLASEAIEKGESIDALRAHIMNAMTAAQTTQATKLDLSAKEQKRFSVFRAIRALTDKTWRGAEFELECHNEILKRTGLQEAVHGGFYMPTVRSRCWMSIGM